MHRQRFRAGGQRQKQSENRGHEKQCLGTTSGRTTLKHSRFCMTLNPWNHRHNEKSWEDVGKGLSSPKTMHAKKKASHRVTQKVIANIKYNAGQGGRNCCGKKPRPPNEKL